MKVLIKVVMIVCFFSVFAYAEDVVQEISFKTLDGKTIGYKAADRTPLVINVGSHW